MWFFSKRFFLSSGVIVCGMLSTWVIGGVVFRSAFFFATPPPLYRQNIYFFFLKFFFMMYVVVFVMLWVINENIIRSHNARK